MDTTPHPTQKGLNTVLPIHTRTLVGRSKSKPEGRKESGPQKVLFWESETPSVCIFNGLLLHTQPISFFSPMVLVTTEWSGHYALFHSFIDEVRFLSGWIMKKKLSLSASRTILSRIDIGLVAFLGIYVCIQGETRQSNIRLRMEKLGFWPNILAV